VLFALCASAAAQQPKKVPRIGFLVVPSQAFFANGIELFRQGIRSLGYVEGKNIVIEYRYAEGKLDRLPALADELVRLKVDVLVGSSTPASLAAQNATKTIPIVFVNVSDPVAAGLIDSLARPGGNITGFTDISPVLAGKRLELLKETIPKLSRVAVLWNPPDPASAQQWKESQLPARELGLQLHSMEVSSVDTMEVSSADKYESAFKGAIKAHSAALAVTLNAVANSNQKRIAELAAKNRLPAIYARGDFVTSGGLVSYGADQAEPYRRTAAMVDKFRKGAKPADLPVEQPTKVELLVNLTTAKALGLEMPLSVLIRADDLIE